MKSPNELLVLTFCIFYACATHRNETTKTQAITTTNTASLFTQLSSILTDKSENIDIIIPKTLTTLPPISGTPSQETPESDTVKIRGRSTTIVHNQGTTTANHMEVTTSNNETQTEKVVTHQSESSTMFSWMTKAFLAFLFIAMIMLIYLPRKRSRPSP